MTILYPWQSLCGPLTNSFAETDRTRIAFDFRVSRWPMLSEGHSGPRTYPGTGVSLTHSVRIVAASGKPRDLRVWVCFVVPRGARLVFCQVWLHQAVMGWWSEFAFWYSLVFDFEDEAWNTTCMYFQWWRRSDAVVSSSFLLIPCSSLLFYWHPADTIP